MVSLFVWERKIKNWFPRLFGKGYGFLVCLRKEEKKLVSSFVWKRVWFPCLFGKGRKKVGFLVCLGKGMVSLFVWER